MQRAILGLGLLVAIMATAILPASTLAKPTLHNFTGPRIPSYQEKIYNYYVSQNGLPVCVDGSSIPPYAWENNYAVFPDNNTGFESIMTDAYYPNDSAWFTVYLCHEYDPLFMLQFEAVNPGSPTAELNGNVVIGYGINGSDYGIELTLTINNGTGYLEGKIDGYIVFTADVGKIKQNYWYQLGFWYNSSTEDIGFIWYNSTEYTYYLYPYDNSPACGAELVLANQNYFISFQGTNLSPSTVEDWIIAVFGTAPYQEIIYPHNS